MTYTGSLLRISIHAPRVGSDVSGTYCGEHQPKFQSTLPVWGATSGSSQAEQEFEISIHAPRVGSDPYLQGGEQQYSGISIHAPRVGSDLGFSLKMHCILYFNPRSPCGERLSYRIDYQFCVLISIHAPRVGSDLDMMGKWSKSWVFQSTLPVWGATKTFTSRSLEIVISIHAPRVGSDI